MGKVLLMAMVLLPRMAMAGTNCWVTDFPDHHEVVCVGDKITASVPAPATAAGRDVATEHSLDTAQTGMPAQTPSKANAVVSVVAVNVSAEKPASARNVVPTRTQASAKAPFSTTQLMSRTSTSTPPVPTTIGLHRPPQSVRDAARSSRMRLIMEERQNQSDI
jgi:hypothetical protein